MGVAHEHQVGKMATLLVGHRRVEPLSAFFCGFDMANLTDEGSCRINHPRIAVWEGAEISRLETEFPHGSSCGCQALRDFL
jgi:hypothetical protein